MLFAMPAVNACAGTLASGSAAGPALAHVGYLPDPARGGRLSGSAQFLDAAAYVPDRFGEIGLEPLGDAGTYLEQVSPPTPRPRSRSAECERALSDVLVAT